MSGSGKDVSKSAGTIRKSVAASFILLFAAVFATFWYWMQPQPRDKYTAPDGRMIVRISMYNSSAYPLWRAFVEKSCPDLAIRWEDNRNAASNVLYMAKHNDIPDLIAIRRFESDTTAALCPYLADLSDLPLTGTFYLRALAPYQCNGKQYWLPEPGLIEGTIANADLFKRFSIPLPTDMPSFIAACDRFSSLGINPFICTMKFGWTCCAMLEGHAIASYFETPAGLAWRRSFEEGTAASVDREAFGAIADTLRTMVDHSILTKLDLSSDVNAVSDMMIRGQAAMGRRSSDELFDASNSYSYTALPMFGKTPSDSRLFTYPVFCLAMAKDAQSSSARRKACEKVLSVMLAPEAQKILNSNGEGLISYCRGVKMPLSASLAEAEPLISEGKYFLRLLNSNSFAAMKNAVAALVAGADNKTFCDLLDRELFAKKAATKAGTSNIEARNELDEHCCSPAGSVLSEIVRQQTGADAAVIDSREAAAPIYRGDFTESDVDALVLNGGVYAAELSGFELRRLLQICVDYTTVFPVGYIEPYIDYPALAGVAITIKKDGLLTGASSPDGSRLGDGCLFKTAVSERIYNALTVSGTGLAAKFSKQGQDLPQCVHSWFAKGQPLPQPRCYINIQQEQ